MLKTEYRTGDVKLLASQVSVDSQIVGFHNVFETENGGVALVAFAANQKLDTHVAPAEVMVYVLEGEVEFTLPDGVRAIKAGEFMLLGAGVSHSVTARAASKLMLVKVK